MKLSIRKKQRFGSLTVIKEIRAKKLPSGQTNRAFLCRCDCGVEKEIRLLHLIRGRIKSCGCIIGEKHGMTGQRLYRIYRAMLYRCYGNKTIQPHLYKDKGITVCKEWRNSFIEFRDWALENNYTDNLVIDRIKNNMGYSASNCRWVTPEQSTNNRENTFRILYNGELIPFMTVIREKKLINHFPAIRGRIKRGWNPQQAIDVNIKKGNYATRTNEKEKI